MKKTLALLFLASTVGAVPCTTLDTTGFTQEQVNLIPGLAYRIGYNLDNQTKPPTVTQDRALVTVCFNNPSFDAVAVITIPSLTAQYNSDTAARNAAKAQYDAWKVQLSTTTTALNNARVAGFKNLTPANQAAVVQGILDWHYLRIQLGIDEK